MTYPVSELSYALDAYISSYGTFGYVALLDDALSTANYTADAVANTLTTSTPHKLVTGSRFRVSTLSGGVLAGGLVAGVDYYAAVTSTTELMPCATLADALAATPIDLSSDGIATQQLIEQTLTADDPIAVLVNHELSGNGYTARKGVTDVGNANPITSPQIAGQKSTVVNFSAVGGDLVYRHVLIIRDGIDTPRDTYGNNAGLITRSSARTVVDGDIEVIPIKFYARNAA